jgi:glycerate kinase
MGVAPGAGTAGGLGFALLHCLNADLKPGFDIVSRTVNLPARVALADVIVTGEGALDIQSLAGKGPGGVALQALLAAKPVVALVGRADSDIHMSGLFHHIGAVLERGHTIAECLERGADFLEEEATRVPWAEWVV